MFELVTEESFDLEKSYEYILSIQVRLDGFSFSVISQQENKLLAFKTTPLKISSIALISRHFMEWIKSEELFQKPFKKVRIIVFSKKFTLIPEKYFHSTIKKEVPQFLFEENSELEIAENVVPKLETRIIFTLPAGLNKIVNEQIGESEIIHPVKIILNNLPELKKEYGLVLLFNANDFYTIIFNKSKILLTNNFKMAHVTDVVYFILTTLKQLKISPSETNLFLAENIIKIPEIENSLLPWFTEINKLELIPFLSKPGVLK